MSFFEKMRPTRSALMAGTGVAAFTWLTLAVYSHFHDDAPPDMSAFDAPPATALEAQAKAEWDAKNGHLRPKTGGVPFVTYLHRASKMRDQIRKSLTTWGPWLAEWERFAETTPNFHAYAGQGPNAWDHNYASRLMRARAALSLLEGTEDEAYEALSKLYRNLRREIEAPQSCRTMGNRGLRELEWAEELLLEAALRAKSPMAAERVLALYLPDEDELIRRFEQAAPYDRHETKLELEQAMKTPPPDFPSDFPTGQADWEKVGEAVSGRWEKANLLPNATLQELLRRQRTAPREGLAHAPGAYFGEPSFWERNYAGHRLAAAPQRMQRFQLARRRIHEIGRAAVRHTWQSGAAAPAALADLELPATTLTNPYTGKPFRYDPAARRIFLDLDEKRTLPEPSWPLPVRTATPAP